MRIFFQIKKRWSGICPSFVSTQQQTYTSTTYLSSRHSSKRTFPLKNKDREIFFTITTIFHVTEIVKVEIKATVFSTKTAIANVNLNKAYTTTRS